MSISKVKEMGEYLKIPTDEQHILDFLIHNQTETYCTTLCKDDYYKNIKLNLGQGLK